jgi:peroxin-3
LVLEIVSWVSELLISLLIADITIVGGIIATYSFLKKDAPEYRPGYAISISFLCFSAVCCIAYFAAVWHDNQRRDRAMASGATVPQEEQESLGDMALNYRYSY